jgi:hypothetical protein
MTFKEMVTEYVRFFGDAEDAFMGTLLIAFVLSMLVIGLVVAWKFTLIVLLILGTLGGMIALFEWASDDL